MLSTTVAIAKVIPEATEIELLIEIRSISQQLRVLRVVLMRRNILELDVLDLAAASLVLDVGD